MVYHTSWFQSLTDKLAYAADYSISIEEDKDTTSTSEATVGAEYKLDCCTKVRAKTTTAFEQVDKKATVTPRFGLGVSQKVSDRCTIDLGADLNAFKLFGSQGGKPHSLGVEVNIS
jgi:predicted porin